MRTIKALHEHNLDASATLSTEIGTVSESVTATLIVSISRRPRPGTELIGIMAALLNLRTVRSGYLPVRFFMDRKPSGLPVLSTWGMLRRRHSCPATGAARQQVDEAISVVNTQWVFACLLQIRPPLSAFHAGMLQSGTMVRAMLHDTPSRPEG